VDGFSYGRAMGGDQTTQRDTLKIANKVVFVSMDFLPILGSSLIPK